MKRLIAIFLAVVLIVGLAACAAPAPTPVPPAPPPAPGQPTPPPDDQPRQVLEWTAAHTTAVGSARDVGLHAMADYIRYAVDGWELIMHVSPAGALGGTLEQIASVQSGILAMAVQPTAHLSGFQPLMSILDIPFILPPDYADLVAVTQGPAGEALRATTDEVDIRTLGIWHDGYHHWTSSRPLHALDDFEGLRIRVMMSPIRISMAEHVGGQVITMDWLEVYNAMMTGAIDSHENPVVIITDAMIHEVQSYLIWTNHSTHEHAVMANLAWWNGLTPEVQEGITRGVEVGRLASSATLHGLEEERVALLQEYMTIIPFPPAELERMREALAPIREEFIENNGQRGADLLALFEAEIARITGR